ncbi:hypothetical protein [Oceanobacillus oncorhynchi]|nr:hypothetical protein [Oceanobacillus oncorhynchi]
MELLKETDYMKAVESQEEVSDSLIQAGCCCGGGSETAPTHF